MERARKLPIFWLIIISIDLDIMTTWLTNEDPDSGTKIHDFNFVQGVPLLAYFDRNILYNFNGGNDNQCYMLHKIQNSDESTRELAKQGYPDILFGYVDLELIFGSEISIKRLRISRIGTWPYDLERQKSSIQTVNIHSEGFVGAIP